MNERKPTVGERVPFEVYDDLRAEVERLRGTLRGVRQVAQDIGDVHDSYLALWIIEQVDRALGDTPDE